MTAVIDCHTIFLDTVFTYSNKGEQVKESSDRLPVPINAESVLTDAYRSLAAIDYLLGVAADAPVPASHLRELLRPLLSDLDSASDR